MADNSDSSPGLTRMDILVRALIILILAALSGYIILNNGFEAVLPWLTLIIPIAFAALYPLRWQLQPIYQRISFAVFFAFEIVVIILVLYSVEWSGFGAQPVSTSTESAKNLWDWLELLGALAIPVAVALIGYLLQSAERERTEKQAQTEREIAEDRIREQRLQDYLDRMTELILEKGLTKPDVSEEVKAVARTRTLATLRSLDGERKGALIKFLYESDLIGRQDKEPIISLRDADITRANLQRAELVCVNFQGANLRQVNFERAELVMGNLEGANLEQVNLQDALFSLVNLDWTNLRHVDLQNADLTHASLQYATLEGTNLAGANLTYAKLDQAYFKAVNLQRAKVTSEQLSKAILDNTTIMPDGSRYKPTLRSEQGFDIMRGFKYVDKAKSIESSEEPKVSDD